VGDVGNRAPCGFPRSGGRVVCVHGSGSFHRPVPPVTIVCSEVAGLGPIPANSGLSGVPWIIPRLNGLDRLHTFGRRTHECFKDLTADSDEEFFFVTGTLINGIYVLDQKIEFHHAKRTAVAVIGEPSSTHKLLIKLERFGHRLLGCFHSHPGKGPNATIRREKTKTSKSAWRTAATATWLPSSAETVTFDSFEWTRSRKLRSTGKEWKSMERTFSILQTSTRHR
jgi:hypothetical protein